MSLLDYLDARLSSRMRANAIPIALDLAKELINSERGDRSKSRSTVDMQRKKPEYPPLCPNCNAVLDKDKLPECTFCGCIVNPLKEEDE